MFPVGLYLFALVGGAVISAASLPLWRRWCKHVGLVDAPGYRKIHDHPVPLAGGLAVITGLVAPILGATAWVWLGPLPESFDRIIAYGLAKRCGSATTTTSPTASSAPVKPSHGLF